MLLQLYSYSAGFKCQHSFVLILLLVKCLEGYAVRRLGDFWVMEAEKTVLQGPKKKKKDGNEKLAPKRSWKKLNQHGEGLMILTTIPYS